MIAKHLSCTQFDWLNTMPLTGGDGAARLGANLRLGKGR